MALTSRLSPLAGVVGKRARQHLHERGLPGAVLAEQRVRLAGKRLLIPSISSPYSGGSSDWRFDKISPILARKGRTGL